MSSETFHDCTVLAAEALAYLIQCREDKFSLGANGALFFNGNWVPQQVRDYLERDASDEMRAFYLGLSDIAVEFEEALT